MSRVKCLTEINSSWQPAGDDATRGWLWTNQEYDWKGRVTRTINTDGTDQLYSYDGCGCAGGQVTTVKGENITETDWQGNNPVNLGRRTQKIYDDIQGRSYKTQVMNWDGITPYTTTLIQFNGRDQATNIKRYDGVETSQTFQETTRTYDGHGRLKTQHRPEQDAGKNTLYNYNADDSVQSVADARGTGTNYIYNSRGLVEQINYSVPTGSTIPVTPTATFVYDNTGNRTQMTDGRGTVTYSYNQLSQMTAEVRQFNDSLADAPLPNNGFRLEYDYGLAGQMTSIKDPYGQQFNYAFDKAGRLNAVTGATAFNGVTNYASNPQYRAWGGLKNLTYGNGLQLSQTFDNRLQTASYSLTGAGNPTMQKNYQYYSDGQLKYVQDVLNPVFDRLNKYDHLGRIKEAKSGAEARNQSAAAPLRRTLPYRQSYSYDAFDNLTQRNNLNWGYSQVNGLRNFNLAYSYNPQNNRVIGIYNWTYDADGRNTYSSSPDAATDSTYDAAGKLVKINQAGVETVRYFDGTGAELKSTARDIASGEIRVKYYLRSTVLGEVISEANATGKKLRTSIYAAGATLARQIIGYDTSGNPNLQEIEFDQWDASGMSYRRTSGNEEAGETDPTGTGVGLNGDNYFLANLPPENDFPLYQPRGFEDVALHQNGSEVACYEDGVVISCARAYRNVENGSSLPQPLGTERKPGRKAGARPLKFETNGFGRITGEYYQATEDGTRTDATTGEEIETVNTVLVQFVIILPDSWNTRQSEERKLTKKEVKKIRDDIQLIFDNNPHCLPLINAILERAESDASPVVSKNPFDVLWAVFQQRGILYVPTPKGEQSSGYAWGSIAKGNAKITLPPRTTLHPSVAAYASKGLIKDFNRTQELLAAQTVLAEVIHLSGAFTYDDRAMSIATADYLEITPPNYSERDVRDVRKWSNWWHPKVNNKCRIGNVIDSENRRRR